MSKMINNDFQGYEFLDVRIPLETVFDIVVQRGRDVENKVEMFGHMVNRTSLRLHTFKETGCTCMMCGKVGTHFRLQRVKHRNEPYHLGLWSDDGYQMSKDHIIPKAKGGRDILSNMQTMCRQCNGIKSDTIM